ncbi:MAG: tetratricopeptide repeat protein [Deltaproteobacteria bacterium]|jgi:tetratricopeptide (TPR) repeat protein
MSYIHEALKKAQKERDGQFKPYGRPTSSGPGLTGLIPRHLRVWILAGGLIVLLAFVSHSWLDFEGHSGPTQKPAKKEQVFLPPQRLERKAPEASFAEQGRRYYREGRFQEAKRCYERALKADPGNALALNNLGVLQIRGRHLVAAKKNFEKAIRLKPDYVDPYYNMACLLAIENQAQESLRYLKKAVSLYPSVKAWACEDSDLRSLQNLPEFRKLVGIKP